mmetsp:Transcript_4444/g.14570  ORF Transcript_4444/g.14570 Transcript_4444/m.14570 type:complete len:246 (+) Transcript_4444:505-1242(+)
MGRHPARATVLASAAPASSVAGRVLGVPRLLPRAARRALHGDVCSEDELRAGLGRGAHVRASARGGWHRAARFVARAGKRKCVAVALARCVRHSVDGRQLRLEEPARGARAQVDQGAAAVPPAPLGRPLPAQPRRALPRPKDGCVGRGRCRRRPSIQAGGTRQLRLLPGAREFDRCRLCDGEAVPRVCGRLLPDLLRHARRGQGAAPPAGGSAGVGLSEPRRAGDLPAGARRQTRRAAGAAGLAG